MLPFLHAKSLGFWDLPRLVQALCLGRNSAFIQPVAKELVTKSPVGAFLVQIVVKKVFRKKSAKLSENGSRNELGPGPAESLKQKN